MRRASPRASYPTIPRVLPQAPDPGSQAIARAADAHTLRALEEPAPTSPGDRLVDGVMDATGKAIGSLVERGIAGVGGQPATQTPIDDHLKLTKDARDQYDRIIDRLEERSRDLERQVDALKAERDGAYQAGYSTAEDRLTTRMELSERTQAQLDEIRAGLHDNQLAAKDGQIAELTARLDQAIAALGKAQADLSGAYTARLALETQVVKKDHAIEIAELAHKLERAESRVPQALSPQERVDEAYADAEAIRLRDVAKLETDRVRQQAQDEHKESEARIEATRGLGKVVSELADKAPSIIESFVAGSAPARGYARPVARPGPADRQRRASGG